MERDKLLGTMDAKVWTDEFMATKARLGNKEFDHAMMLSWFANAIMAGFDEANRRAQRALDAERERVAFLDKKNVALVEASNLVLKVKAEQDAQLATLQAQLAAAKKVKADYDRWLSGGVYFTTAEYEKHVAGHKQQVQALQAQLRQVEGERDGLEQNCLDHHVATEQADAKVLKLEGEKGLWASERIALLTQLENAEADLDTLRQLVEALINTWVNGRKIHDGIPLTLRQQIDATLAAKDAGKEVPSA